MDSTGAQQVFFNHIKGMLPPHISFVDEIAEELKNQQRQRLQKNTRRKTNRFRGSKKLCVKYKISLDQLLHLNSESVVF